MGRWIGLPFRFVLIIVLIVIAFPFHLIAYLFSGPEIQARTIASYKGLFGWAYDPASHSDYWFSRNWQ